MINGTNKKKRIKRQQQWKQIETQKSPFGKFI